MCEEPLIKDRLSQWMALFESIGDTYLRFKIDNDD